MKKSTIWIIATIMGISFISLLLLQISYMDAMAKMKREQFDESVNRALYQASQNLEMDETLRYLEKDINSTERKAIRIDSVGINSATGGIQQSHQYAVAADDGTIYSSFELNTIMLKPSSKVKFNTDKNTLTDATKSFQEIVRNRYIYQKSLLDEVIYNILYTASEKPLKERINFKQFDQDIRAELLNNGINIPYHFRVETNDGREVYRCPEYSDEGEEYLYTQTLFHNDPQSKMGVVKVHFPEMSSYIYSSIRFMIPSIIFTIVLLITFIFTIFIIFRQKKISEMRNDFINNMTHEFKTPISSISLAAQMLRDESITKTPAMLNHASKVIVDETKRLRFQVDKVLQMSMFEGKKVTFKMQDADINEIVENVVNTFALKVQACGGKIETDIGAVDSGIFVDEMHFTNVVFNLMDNAVKYRNQNVPLQLLLSTWNEGSNVCLSIQDNGIGIKRDNLKKIFEKFYRVHTGNRHDVKGFGLGLAYVKQIVELHKGSIHAESELGKGTKFIIKLPVKE